MKTFPRVFAKLYGLWTMVIAVASSGCSLLSPEVSVCAQGQQQYAGEWLYFGRRTPGGEVTDSEWSAFLDTAVTPYFPDGLSVFKAAGQWRSDSGVLIREPSFVLNLLHPDNAADEVTLRRIMAEYKTRFKQESVLRVKTLVCAEFQ